MAPAACKSRIRIGTRRSRLAMAQARIVAGAITAARGDLHVEFVPIVTSGDRLAGRLAAAGGKGLFTTELERALRDGDIDIAVHSAKDLPAAMADDLAIVAVPAREDPRDALVSRGGGGVSDLPERGRVGTGSLRRAAQLLALRRDLEIVPIRGNVDTRLRKALSGDAPAADRIDAAVLAMAGLIRSGLADRHAENIRPLDVAELVPAAGQGALAVQAVADNKLIAAPVAQIDDPCSHTALLAERSVLTALGADCRSCIGVYIRPDGAAWRGLAAIGDSRGTHVKRLQSAAETAELAARELVVLAGRPPGA